MKLEIATRYTLVDANEQSNQIIPGSYEDIIKLPNGFFALIGDGFCKICDSSGNPLHLINTRNNKKFLAYRMPDFICLNINQTWWFMQKDGKLLASPYDDIDCSIGTDCLIGVCQNGKWGYANNLGKLCIPAQYEHLHYFSHFSSLPILVQYEDKFTFFSTGEDDISFDMFDTASPFKLEPTLKKFVARVTLNNKKNLLLTDGSFVFDEFVDDFFIHEDSGIITTLDNYKSWYTLNGNKIIENCLSIVPQKNLPLFVVKKETGYGIIDEFGFPLTDCIYDSQMLLTDKMFILQKDGKLVLYKCYVGEIFTPETLCSKKCSDKEYLEYVLKALNYYLS